MKVFERIRWNDSCPVCRKGNTIRLLTRDNCDVNYTNILNKELPLPKMVIGMRCINCKTVFNMKWECEDNYKYPIPSTKVELDKFVDKFKGDIRNAIT